MGKKSGCISAATERLAETFERLVPLRPERPRGAKPPSADELARIGAKALAEFYDAARIERERNHLGILGRARVAFGLQQRLQAAGYPPQLVKQVLFSLLTAAFVGGAK